MRAKKQKKTFWNKTGRDILILLAVTAVLVVTVVVTLTGFDPSQEEIAEKLAVVPDDSVIMSTHEKDDRVIVSTVYGNLNYPFAYSDLLQIVPVTDEGGVALEFYGKLEHGNYLLYTLWLGKEQGKPVGTVFHRNGDAVNVYLEMAKKPWRTKHSDENSFYAAQETVNDILRSFIPDYADE